MRPLIHQRQYGGLLIELITVVTIISLLSAVALPTISHILLRKDMQAAEQSIVQTLRNAKTMARSRSVFVTVHFAQNNQIVLQTSDGNTNALTVNLPSRVQLVHSGDFVFTPNGDYALAGGANNGIAQLGTRIIVRPRQSGTDEGDRTVQVSAFGAIASL